MSARNSDVKASMLYASKYLDAVRQSSPILSSNGYRFALITVSGSFDVLDTLAVRLLDSDDLSYSHVALSRKVLSPGQVQPAVMTILVDKNVTKKNLLVEVTGTGDNTVNANTRPSCSVVCFEFAGIQGLPTAADYRVA